MLAILAIVKLFQLFFWYNFYKGDGMENNRQGQHEYYKNNFRRRLKELRQEKLYSQKTLAEKLGIAVSTYANWEQGRTEPSVYDIFNLLKVLEIEAGELFDIDI